MLPLMSSIPERAAAAADVDLLCFGEPMIELAELPDASRGLMQLGFGGDASNVAIAAARQGLRSGFVSAVGDDTFGTRLIELWDRETVDRRYVLRPAGSRTGLYFITYGPEGHVFSYVRAGSAASRYSTADLPIAALATAPIFHASGISQGIGDAPCDATFAAMRLARNAGRLVSYDTNLRLKLWSLDRARAVIHAAAALTDILRPGLDDARLLTGLEQPDAIVDFYLRLGCGLVILTLGAEGCLAASPERRETIAPHRVAFRDAAGAGDTFTGAFLAEYHRSRDAFAAARYANVAAALQTRGHGAIDPIPHRAEVEATLRTVASAEG